MQAPVPLREGTAFLRDGRQIGWAEFGDSNGVPVLWFHGTPGGRRQIPPEAPARAVELHVRLIAVERPGIGHSTHDPDRTLLSWASDVRQVVDHLGVDQFGIIGLSGGGPHVLAVAHKMPERVFGAAVLGGLAPMVGDEAAHGGYFPGAVTLLQLARYVREPLGNVLSLLLQPIQLIEPTGQAATRIFDAVLMVWPQIDRPHMSSPGMREMFLTDIIGSTRNGVRSLLQDLTLFGQPWGFSLTDVKVPVRIWHADTDVTVPYAHAQKLDELLPDSELTVVTGEGHFAGFMRPREVFKWLRAHAPVTV